MTNQVKKILPPALFLMLFALSAHAQPAALSTKTRENLHTAYRTEINAARRYKAFAERADTEGFTALASLFRASARSEEIQAKNSANGLILLGDNPSVQTYEPDIKSTLENMRASFFEETQERDSLYPAYLKAATAENNVTAIRIFEWSQKAEAEHAKLFLNALNDSPGWKTGKKQYIVCPRCGFITEQTSIQLCPISFEPRANFIPVE